MLCALMGLSPCDVILEHVDLQTVRCLYMALNNRFDVGILRQVRDEFRHVSDVLDNRLIEDYLDPDDRKLASKLRVEKMSAFSGGSQLDVDDPLAGRPRGFVGRVRTVGGVVEVHDEKALGILGELYEKRSLVRSLISLPAPGKFSDEVFFGRPLSVLALSSGFGWLTSLAADRIFKQDGVDLLKSDADRLFSIYEALRSGDSDTGFVHPPITAGDVEMACLSHGCEHFSAKHSQSGAQLLSVVNSWNLALLPAPVIDAIVDAFAVCVRTAERYDAETARVLEQCGLFFMNDVRTEYMLSVLRGLSMVSEGSIDFVEVEYDPLEIVLPAISAVAENDLLQIGGGL